MAITNETEQEFLEQTRQSGYNARLASALPEDNPYQIDMFRWFAWLHGWREADRYMTRLYRQAKARIEDSAELRPWARVLLEVRSSYNLKQVIEGDENELACHAANLDYWRFKRRQQFQEEIASDPIEVISLEE